MEPIVFLSGFLCGILAALFMAHQFSRSFTSVKREDNNDDWWKKGEKNPFEIE